MNIKCMRLEILIPFNEDPKYDKFFNRLRDFVVAEYGGCSIEYSEGYFRAKDGNTIKDQNRKLIVDIRYRNILDRIKIKRQTQKIYKDALASLNEEEIYITLTKTKVYVDIYRDILGIF